MGYIAIEPENELNIYLENVPVTEISQRTKNEVQIL